MSVSDRWKYAGICDHLYEEDLSVNSEKEFSGSHSHDTPLVKNGQIFP